MKPEIEALIKSLLQGVEKVGAAAWNEAPLVLQDFLTAGLIDNGTVLVVGVLLLGLAVFLGRLAYKLAHDDKYYGDGDVVSVCFGVISGLGGLIITPSAVVNILTIIYAPRAYLLEKVGGMLK